MKTLLIIFISLVGFTVQAEVEVITLSEKTLTSPSTYLEEGFLKHASEILKKIVRKEDPNKIYLGVTEKQLPVVDRVKNEIGISFGAMVALDYEDELAFLLVRALEGNPSFADIEGCTRVMKRFILYTPYNPSAAVEYFEKMVRITENLESYREKDEKYTNTLMRQQRELAKGLIKHYSWTEIDLSQRIVDFRGFPESLFEKLTKGPFYLSFYHRFFGPDYEKRFDQAKPILNFIGTILVLGIPIFALLATDNLIKCGTANLLAKAAQTFKWPALESLRWPAYFLGVTGAGLSANYYYNSNYHTPPEILKKETKELLDLIALLDSRKGTLITAEEFLAWFNRIRNVALDTERTHWFGNYMQSIYEKMANLALSSKIRIDDGLFNVNPSHFKVLTYPLLVKLSAIFRYKELSAADRVRVLKEENDRLRALEAKYGKDYMEHPNSFPFWVAIRVLAEFNEDVDGEVEFNLALNNLFHSRLHSWRINWYGYTDLLPDLAGDRCDLFFKFNAEYSLETIIREVKAKDNIHQCLVREISRHAEFGKIIRHISFLKKNFPDDEKTINLASRKLHSILTRYASLQEFVSDLEKNAFNEDSPVFFEVASSIGESLAERSHLITNIADIHLVLETQSFWAYRKSDAQDINSEALDLLKSIRRSSNGYNIELTEKLHGILYAKWKSFNPNPSQEEAVAIWEKMVKRGTSIYSDQLFWEVYSLSTGPEHRQKLEEYALAGLLHNQEKKKHLVMNKIHNSQFFEKIKSLDPLRDREERAEIINAIVKSSKEALGTSTAHLEIMEAISKDIETTEKESALVEKGKYDVTGVGKEARDDSFGLLTAITGEMKQWSKERQWDLILFLVGHRESIDAASRNFLLKLGLTPLRLRDLFDALPSSYQYTSMDALLNQRNGLLETISLKEEWTRRVVDHLLSLVHQDARQIVEEMVDSYLEALKKPGLQYYRSTVFAHLLVSSKKGSQNGNVLTETCKHFGAFGIKIGQFLLASGVLPEEENKALLNLEDNARSPTREKMYEDLREIFGDKPIPYTIKENVGGASLKYVVRAETMDKRDVAVKILSKDALIHTKLEERLLKDMAAVLVRKHGQKYGIFKSAVHAAAEAIKREIDFDAEVKRSALARENMYKQCGKGVTFYPVKETLVHERLIEAEYAPGSNIQRLEGNSKDRIAAGIVDCEAKNFFAENPDSNVIYFDPDRHSGNYRVTDDTVYPIDFGQLHSVSVEERARLIDLAAVAGILSTVGERGVIATHSVVGPFVDHILNLFGQPSDKKQELVTALSAMFSQYHSETGLTPYYRLISVIEDAGLLNLKDRILCYDLPKGLLQLSRLGKLAVKHDASAIPVEAIYKSKVEARANELWSTLGKDPSLIDLGLSAIRYSFSQSRQENVGMPGVAQECEYFGTKFSQETCVLLENPYLQFIVQYFLLPLSFEGVSSIVGKISDSLYSSGVSLGRFTPIDTMIWIDEFLSRARDPLSRLSRLPSSLNSKIIEFLDKTLRPAVVWEFFYLFLIQDVALKRIPKWILRAVGLDKYEEYVDSSAFSVARVFTSSFLGTAAQWPNTQKARQNVFMISFVYGMVMEVTGSLYYPIAMHSIYNVAQFLRR